MDEQRDGMSLQVTVGPLAQWPDDHVRRAYRLSVAAVRSRHARSLGPDAANPLLADETKAAEEEAALFGRELLRRGLL